MKTLVVLGALAVAATACGTEELACGEGGDPYYPLAVGAWWVDRVEDTQTGSVECKVVSIGAEASIPLRPDVVAFPALSKTGDEEAHRWQQLLDDGSVRRHLDEWFVGGARTKIAHYCPHKIRVDDGAHACPGAAWTETWSELTISVDGAANPDDCANLVSVDPGTCAITGDLPAGCAAEAVDGTKSWEVVAVDEQITVPAGTFTTLHVRTDDGEVINDRWWTRGVGKIAETEAETREELIDYCLPIEGCTRPIPDEAELDPDNGCAPL
jgi:hypothetical protein